MFSFPPLPPWDGLHPIVIHFPIALIFVSPLLILLALLWKKHTGILLIAAALLMTIAAAGAVVATSTGEEALELVPKTPGPNALLEEHEELGEAARNITIALASVLLIAAGLMWKFVAQTPRSLIVALGLLYLIANAAGALVVANTAHIGGRLVHELGIRARTSTISAPNLTPGSVIPQSHKDKDD